MGHHPAPLSTEENCVGAAAGASSDIASSSCCIGMEGEQGDLHRLGKILPLLLLLREGSVGFEVDRRRQGALASDPVWAIDEDPFYVAIVPLRRPVPMYDASIIFSSSKVRKEFHFF